MQSEVKRPVSLGRAAASHKPAPLGVPLRVPLLGVHLAAKWGHQVQQRVLRGLAEERQQKGHTEARGTLALWVKTVETCVAEPPTPANPPPWEGSWTRASDPPCTPPAPFPVLFHSEPVENELWTQPWVFLPSPLLAPRGGKG